MLHAPAEVHVSFRCARYLHWASVSCDARTPLPFRVRGGATEITAEWYGHSSRLLLSTDAGVSTAAQLPFALDERRQSPRPGTLLPHPWASGRFYEVKGMVMSRL
jgi:hypothetical protein